MFPALRKEGKYMLLKFKNPHLCLTSNYVSEMQLYLGKFFEARDFYLQPGLSEAFSLFWVLDFARIRSFVLPGTLQRRHFHWPHFTDKETEIRKEVKKRSSP